MIVTLLFLSFFVFMAVGIPIGFAMAFAATSLILGVTTPLAIVFQKMVSGVDSFPLLALPLFVTAGILMHHGGISNKMFGVINCLIGHVTGGLAIVMSLSIVVNLARKSSK